MSTRHFAKPLICWSGESEYITISEDAWYPARKNIRNGFGRKKRRMAKGHSESSLNTVDKYSEARDKRTQEYILLKEYNHTVEKGEIHVLTGYTVYKNIAQVLEDKVIGLKTFDGIFIESYTTHFIDRVIGHTSTQHKGMRMGVKVSDVCDALKNGTVEKDYAIRDDYRRQYIGESCSVAVSISEQKIIQVNPI